MNNLKTGDTEPTSGQSPYEAAIKNIAKAMGLGGAAMAGIVAASVDVMQITLSNRANNIPASHADAYWLVAEGIFIAACLRGELRAVRAAIEGLSETNPPEASFDGADNAQQPADLSATLKRAS